MGGFSGPVDVAEGRFEAGGGFGGPLEVGGNIGGPSEVTGGFGGTFVWGKVKLGGCGGGPGIVDGGPGIVGGGPGIVVIGVRGVLSRRFED